MWRMAVFNIFLYLALTMVFTSLVSAEEYPNYEYVFENKDILPFYITVDRADWQKMWDQPFQYVKCTVRCFDEVYEDVGLRFKGNSSFGVRGLKKPYKLKFDKYKKQRFHGFKKLNFSNGFKDPSLLREKLAYDLFREADVPAPRTTFAKLYLTIPGEYDEEYIGFYTIVEQVDKVFLKDRFGDTGGSLFKGEGMADFIYRGDEPERYEKEYEAKLSEEQQDYSVLIRFTKMLNETSDEEFPSEIRRVFNVETFLSWLAVNTLLSNLDSYAGSGHNFYVYFRKDTAKCEFVPWDLNEAFGNFRMGRAEDMTDLRVYKPYAEPKILIQRIINIPEFRERYIRKIKDLMDGPFQQSMMYDKIDALFNRIEADVRADPWKPFTTEEFVRSLNHHIGAGNNPMINSILGLKPFVVERIRSVNEQLAGKREGYVPRSFKKPPFDGEDPPMEDEISHRIDELHRLMEERKSKGIDISEAERLDDESKEYAQRGDMKGAFELISKAIELLKLSYP